MKLKNIFTARLYFNKQLNGSFQNGKIPTDQELLDDEEKKGPLEALNDVINALAADNYGSINPMRSYGSICLLYTSPSPRDKRQSRMPSSA